MQAQSTAFQINRLAVSLFLLKPVLGLDLSLAVQKLKKSWPVPQRKSLTFPSFSIRFTICHPLYCFCCVHYVPTVRQNRKRLASEGDDTSPESDLEGKCNLLN